MNAATKLVLHHGYRRAAATDLSEHGNHGVRKDVGPGTGANRDTAAFRQSTSWVEVAPTPSLEDLRAIHVRMRFQVDPQALTSYRWNLMEGHASFAFFVNVDGSLQGTVYDGVTWPEVMSAPGTIRLRQWHDASFVHDGLGHGQLWVDGMLVAERFDQAGPVRGVGPSGIAVGHWPHPDGQYTLDGFVDEARLWVYDPREQSDPLIDDCCFDRKTVDAVLDGLTEGHTRTEAMQLTRRLLDAAAATAVDLRGGTASGTGAMAALARAGMAAFRTKDGRLLRQVLGQIRTRAQATGSASFDALGAELYDAMRSVGVLELVEDPEQVDALARALCVDWVAPDRDKPGRDPHKPEKPDPDAGDRPPPKHKPPSDADRKKLEELYEAQQAEAKRGARSERARRKAERDADAASPKRTSKPAPSARSRGKPAATAKPKPKPKPKPRRRKRGGDDGRS